MIRSCRRLRLCLSLVLGVSAAASAQPSGVYVPSVDSVSARLSLSGSLRLCPLADGRAAADLRLQPASVVRPMTGAAVQSDGRSADGCAGFGVLESGGDGLAGTLVGTLAGTTLRIDADEGDTLRLTSMDAGGRLCTRDRLPDGHWRRAAPCETWRPLEIAETHIALRELDLFDGPLAAEAGDDFLAALATLGDGTAAPQAQATLARMLWRERCGAGC